MLLIAGIRNKTQVFSGNFSKFQLAFSLHFDRYRIWNLDFWKSDFLKKKKKKRARILISWNLTFSGKES